MTIYLLIFVLGLASGCLSGIVGAGAGIVLLPILVFKFGPQEAVPIMAIAGLLGNIAKVASWWRDVEWRAFLAYTIAGSIGAAVGARTLLVLPPDYAEAILGVLFILMVPVRFVLKERGIRIGILGLALSGLGIGFISGIVLTTGPLSIPAFAAYGMTKGALLSTEAMAVLIMQASKLAVFWQGGVLPLESVLKGLLVGSSVMIGAFAGRTVVQRMSVTLFERVLDTMLIAAGLSMLWAAFA